MSLSSVLVYSATCRAFIITRLLLPTCIVYISCLLSEIWAPALTFMHFSFLGFFCTIMLFIVLFQKIDSNLGVVIIGAEVTHSDAGIIGANFSYVAADVASLRGSAP
jgi:hypothetical protein